MGGAWVGQGWGRGEKRARVGDNKISAEMNTYGRTCTATYLFQQVYEGKGEGTESN